MKFPIQQYLLIAIATVAAISVGVCLFAVAQIEAMHIAVALNDKAKFDAIYMEASHWIFIQLALIVAVGFAAGFLALQRIRTRSREITEQVQCLLEGTKLPESAADEFASVTTVLKRLEHELERMSQQVRSLSQASRDGDLRLRSEPERLTGPFRDVMEDINTILNQALDPVNAQAAILRKMAEGTLDSRITEEFAGDHAKISDAINKVADIASLAMAEFDALITAFEAGDYDRRAQTEQFAGSWKRIMLGVNNVLGTLHRTTKVAQSQTWIKTGLADLADQMGGDLGVGDLSHQVVNFLARYTDAQMDMIAGYFAAQK